MAQQCDVTLAEGFRKRQLLPHESDPAAPSKRPCPITDDTERTAPTHSVEPMDLSPSDSLGADSQERESTARTATEICYGMICDIPIRFIDDHRDLLQEEVAETGLAALALSFTEDRCRLFYGNQETATLNKKDFRNFQDLGKTLKIEFEGVLTNEQLQDENGSPTELVCVNIYGRPEIGDAVADALSAERYFLQDPYWKPSDIEYRNPQYLDIPIFDYDVNGIANHHPETAANAKIWEQLDTYVNNYGIDFDKVLDDFARHDYLVQATVDARISTTMLSHQREALDFILKREFHTSPSERSLWELDDMDENEPVYRHIIAGATNSVPKDILGGILADEMGLGKSLTMLSAIIASLDDALAYARSKTSIPWDGSQMTIAAKSTLLIVPSALLIDNWIEEIIKHVHQGQLSYFKYHGYSRRIHPLRLLENDVVLTTYGTLVAEINKKQSILFEVSWYRIILDEAHIIRNRSTKQFKAVQKLRSAIRWCVTGTPIQNKVDDLGSLVTFLKLPILEEPAQFRRHITNGVQPTKKHSLSDFQNLHTLLSSICLRRNKTVLPVSGSTEEPCELSFTIDEKKEYDKLGDRCLEALNWAVSGHNVNESRHTVIEAILKLRLFCNNGAEQKSSWMAGIPDDPEEAFSLLQQSNSAMCHYCNGDVLSVGGIEDRQSANITLCQKLVCLECIDIYMAAWNGNRCPICNAQHPKSTTQSNQHSPTTNKSEVQYPTKLKKLCENIQEYQHAGKSIVFSFWKKTLDLACRLFEEKGIPYLRLDGDIPYSKRMDVISKFKNDANCTTLFMTLGIGAVGLNNLSVANQIHILEPQWNPAVESQAIGRVVRLGQQKQVRIVRYMMRGSVEKSVQDRQIQKLRLSKEGFTGGKAEHYQQTARMIRDLIHPVTPDV